MRIVMKFGGSSLASSARVLGAASKVAARVKQGDQVVVVVSAQGDTTDEMIQRAESIHPAAKEREMDALLSAGEQMSAALMAMALDSLGVDAISLTGMQAGLRTDGTHGNARIQGLINCRIGEELAQGKAVVVAGFQGVSEAGDITTLGRGGSDTTAVALAAYLAADRCLIYTDVDGVYDRDPRKYPNAVKFARIGYDPMLGLCRQGAQVLHDRCVELAKEKKVEIEVLSSFRSVPGTLVTDAVE